jgi:hypothetical protein
MRKRFLLAAVAGVVVVMLGFGFWSMARPSRPVAVMLYPNGPAEQRLWPLNSSWVWSVKPLVVTQTGKALALVVRIRQIGNKGGDHGAIDVVPQPATRADCKQQLSTGMMAVKIADSEAIVALQLIDLGEVGLQSPDGPGKLRLRFDLSLGGRVGASTVNQEGSTRIDGDRQIGCSTVPDPQWRDGELHLQTLYISSNGEEMAYDVILTATEPFPG